MKTIRTIMTVSLAIILVALGIWLGHRFTAKAPGLTQTVVLEKVKMIAKIATIEYYISDVVKFDAPGEKPWPFNRDAKALIIARGKVLAGFDLNNTINCTISTNGFQNRVEIHLPQPEVIAVDTTFQYYDSQNLSADQQEQLLAMAKLTLKNTAMTQGIFNSAKQSLTTLLPELFPNTQFQIYYGDKPNVDPHLQDQTTADGGKPVSIR